MIGSLDEDSFMGGRSVFSGAAQQTGWRFMGSNSGASHFSEHVGDVERLLLISSSTFRYKYLSFGQALKSFKMND